MKWLSPRNRWAQRYGSLLVLLPLLLLLSWPAWSWWLLWGRLPRACLVDKTVPAGMTREHDSLQWLLHHEKVTTPDYVGPHKAAWDGHSQLQSSDLSDVRWLFLADTYGIYRGENPDPEGGLSEGEIDLIEKYVQGGGFLYGEFNCLASPTQGAARQRLENLLGVHFSGWTGRFFEDLADPQEVPVWLRRALKTRSDQDWIFSGPGYVLLHEDGRVVVLREGQDVPQQALQIETSDGRDVAYGYWFDVVTLSGGGPSRMVAQYRWQTFASGRARLQQQGLPLTFPAVVQGPRTLYCCGDFADNSVARGPYWLAGWPAYKAWRAEDSDDAAARFFWTFYVPLLQGWLTANQR